MQTRNIYQFSKVLLMTCSAIFLVTQSSFAMEKDKQFHMGVSAGMGAACTTLVNLVTTNKWVSGIGCFVAVSAIGGVKEIIDPYQGGTRDIYDMYADLAGAGLGVTATTVAFELAPRFEPTIRPLAKTPTKIDAKAETGPIAKKGSVTRFGVTDGEITEVQIALKPNDS